MITIRDYKKVQTIEDAWQLNQKPGNCVLGGMLWLKTGKRQIQTAIDLSDLGLNQIVETKEEIIIGAMVTLRQLETHEGIGVYTNGAMKEALCHIAGTQFRNLATVGGSVFGRYGFSDVLTMLLAMDSYVELYQGGKKPLSVFATQSQDRDILMRVIIKKKPGQFFYQSVRNSKTDIPILTCGAAVFEEKEGERQWKLAFGARPARAVLLPMEAEQLQGSITKKEAEFFGAYAAKQMKTESNLRGSATYRTHLVQVLAERAVLQLGGIV